MTDVVEMILANAARKRAERLARRTGAPPKHLIASLREYWSSETIGQTEAAMS